MTITMMIISSIIHIILLENIFEYKTCYISQWSYILSYINCLIKLGYYRK